MPDTSDINKSRNAEVINDYQHLRIRLREQHAGQKIVCTIGSWDILHEGHVAYLNEARRLGDVLVVGVDSDEAYKRYKKESSFYPEEDRQTIMAALRYVDYVTIVRDVDPAGEWEMDLVKIIRPDVFVCNSKSYSLEQRSRIEDLCTGVVRLLPFHMPEDSRSVDVSQKLKKSGRSRAQWTALIAANVTFMVSVLLLYPALWPLSTTLATWSSAMAQDLPLLPTYTWAQLVGSLAVSIGSIAIAAVVGRTVSRKH